MFIAIYWETCKQPAVHYEGKPHRNQHRRHGTVTPYPPLITFANAFNHHDLQIGPVLPLFLACATLSTSNWNPTLGQQRAKSSLLSAL